MKQLALVGLGGCLGALCRYQLGGWILHQTATLTKFPVGTLVVNVLGCLIGGLLTGLIEKRDWFSPDTRLLLFTRMLGGFTTFSAFGLETVVLLRRGEWAVATWYVLLSVCGGVAALALGMSLVGTRPPE